jgi:two-component system response regulator ChvI
MTADGKTLNLLVVDDDDLFRETLAQNLEEDGFAVREAADGAAALELLGETPPDGVILDWNMPDMNGLNVLKKMRADGIDVPVLFLTGHSDQLYEESALESGAADFVDKSRSYAILKMRLDLMLCADTAKGDGAPVDGGGGGSEDGDLALGPLVLRGASKRALWREAEVGLTISEFDIVRHLAASPGKDIRFRELYDVVHGKGFHAGHGEDGYRTNVRTFIKRIRRKFRDIDSEFDAIENYPGFGYRWTADDS